MDAAEQRADGPGRGPVTRRTATPSQDALPGMEPGRRVERTEWGLQFTTDTYFGRRGQVERRPSEANARECAGRTEYGWRGTEVVKRTVVTYTTDWEPA